MAVATFTADPDSDLTDYTATIAWGDGSSTQGTVDGQDGNFTVSGNHTYLSAGIYTLSVTVTGPDGTPVTASGVENIATGAVTQVSGFQIGVSVGQSGEVVGEFGYGNPLAPASAFTAWIDPGDGSGPVVGTVASLGDGLFSVSLPHGYASAGPYTATITVTDPHGAQTTSTSTVEVGDIVAGEPATLTAAAF